MTRNTIRSMRLLRQISSGALLLGILQAFGGIDFNQIWFQFLATLASLFASVFFGDPTALAV